MEKPRVAILGIFVADAAFRAARQPHMGETLIGSGFALGPGGKGSNQAVAAARLGSDVSFISRIGDDAFARMAQDMWIREGINPLVVNDRGSFTGAAYIFVDEKTGDNAIIVVPGAARDVSPADLDRCKADIENAEIFVTQLETPIEAAMRGLEIASGAGVTTVFNPAPAVPLDPEIFKFCDYVVPNETEAAILTGEKVESTADAKRAATALMELGAKRVIITLGANGALFVDGKGASHVDAFDAGPVVETTGAGDCFCGAFAFALARGINPADSIRFACAAASISVTRPGTAPSMPTLDEVDALLARSI